MRPTLLVALGGAAGALLRWGVTEMLDHDPTAFPWATLIVNLAGCLAIGFAARRLTLGSDAWYGLVTGVLGGLTTFSAFALETRDLVDAGREGLAVVYVAVTVVGGLVAVEIARGPGRP